MVVEVCGKNLCAEGFFVLLSTIFGSGFVVDRFYRKRSFLGEEGVDGG